MLVCWAWQWSVQVARWPQVQPNSSHVLTQREMSKLLCRLSLFLAWISGNCNAKHWEAQLGFPACNTVSFTHTKVKQKLEQNGEISIDTAQWCRKFSGTSNLKMSITKWGTKICARASPSISLRAPFKWGILWQNPTTYKIFVQLYSLQFQECYWTELSCQFLLYCSQPALPQLTKSGFGHTKLSVDSQFCFVSMSNLLRN